MDIAWWHMIRIVGWTVMAAIVATLFLFGFFNLPGPVPNDNVTFGVTFSSRYASDLGLDWRETYRALFDEMGVRKIRLPVYWDLIESRPGEYDFSDLDFQVEEALRYDAEIILVVGQRVPRWPECHIPQWAENDSDLRRKSLLQFIGKTVERYRGYEHIVMWQVENEPFLTFFGECPSFEKALLDEEAALVKALDARPILVTDSGELSLWFRAAKRGDIFGTTMYRHIYKDGIGYFTYPVGPNFFLTKQWLTKILTNQEHFIVIELQAEPWANGWIADVPLGEQFRTMDERKLMENIEYAKRVGFPEIYLWGAEWWYWLKEKKNYPAVWETAKAMFEDGYTANTRYQVPHSR